MTVKNPYNKKHMPFGNAASIKDKDTMEILQSLPSNSVLFDEGVHERFVEMYLEWIKQSRNNQFIGLDQFQNACFSNGTTEAFDKFYMKNKNKRFRCFRGEYAYHQLAWRNNWPDWKYIDEDELKQNDAVIISLPFSDTGNKHESMDDLLRTCTELNIPVLLDCAYFGICSAIEFDLSHDCITDVTFSLSKTFPVSHLRIGMRLTRINDDDPLFVSHSNGYVNRFAAAVGIEFLKRFSPDYIFDKYRDKQMLFCEHLNVQPSQTVIFGIANSEWKDYNRGNDTNRLSFHKYLSLEEQVFFNEHQKK